MATFKKIFEHGRQPSEKYFNMTTFNKIFEYGNLQ